MRMKISSCQYNISTHAISNEITQNGIDSSIESVSGARGEAKFVFFTISMK